MSKKLIVAVALLLVAAVVLCACENKKYTEVDKIQSDDGKEIVIYEDEEGTKYVENKDGDKVPVTQSPDGFYDDLNSLVENGKPSEDKKDDKEEDTTDGGIVIGDGTVEGNGDASISYDDIATVS